MLTGLTPSLHGASKWRKLDRTVPYLPEILSHSGFLTDGVVSGPYLSQWFGFERGFHSYRAKSDPPADETVDVAIEALRRGRGLDQFVFVHLFDPHWPYFPAADLIERFGERPPDISDLLDLVQRRREPHNPSEIRFITNLYDAEISQADRAIGRFLNELRAEGIYDQALIILTGDHGEAFYEHGHWQHSVSLYEELLRVPLIVKWPGRALRGRSDALVSHVDIFPTILEEAGIESSSSGVGLRKLSQGDDEGEPRAILSEFKWLLDNETRVKISFRTPELKYIATVSIPPEKDASLDMLQEEELYDLAVDPGERHDVSSTRPDAIGAFQQMLLDYLERSQNIQATAHGEEVILDESTKEKLRELGYVHE
jgi:arylsulfatase A-like enzyme